MQSEIRQEGAVCGKSLAGLANLIGIYMVKAVKRVF